jgi:hypothetical protein
MLLSEMRKQLKEKLNPEIEAFQKKVDDLESGFLIGSRDWILRKIEVWLNGSANDQSTLSACHLFWIRADAGMGKSVLAAKVAKVYSEFVIGTVFFSFSETKLSNPEIIIRSLAYQISEKYPEVIEDMLAVKTTKINELFEQLIIEPMKKINSNAAQSATVAPCYLLLIIDALDECTEGKERDDLLHFINSSLLVKLPNYVRVLITSRPEPDIIESLTSFKPYEVSENDENHQKDLELYIRTILSRILDSKQHPALEGNELEIAVLQVLKSSGGSFIYASLLQEEIRSWKRKPEKKEILTKLGTLPKGIDAIFLQIMKDEVFDVNKNFLKLMVIAKRSLSENELLALLDSDELDRAIEDLSRIFLRRKLSDGEFYFIPFHKSIIDWLKDKKRSKEYCIDVEEAHHFMISKLIRLINAPSVSSLTDIAGFSIESAVYEKTLTSSVLSSYTLDFLCDHLDDIYLNSASLVLLTCLTWIRARIKTSNITAIKSDFIKRIRSADWLKEPGSTFCLKEFTFVYDFLAGFDSPKTEEEQFFTSFCENVSCKFRKLLLSDEFMSCGISRIRLLVKDAICWLDNHQKTVPLGPPSFYIGDAFLGKFDGNYVKCIFLLQEEGILICCYRESVRLFDIIKCCEIGEPLKFKNLWDTAKHCCFQQGLLIVAFSSTLEFWSLDTKHFKWTSRKTLTYSVQAMYQVSPNTLFLWGRCLQVKNNDDGDDGDDGTYDGHDQDSDLTGFTVFLASLEIFPCDYSIPKLASKVILCDNDHFVNFQTLQDIENKIASRYSYSTVANIYIGHSTIIEMEDGMRFYFTENDLTELTEKEDYTFFLFQLEQLEIKLTKNFVEDNYCSETLWINNIKCSTYESTDYQQPLFILNSEKLLIAYGTSSIKLYRLDYFHTMSSEQEFRFEILPLTSKSQGYLSILWKGTDVQVLRKTSFVWECYEVQCSDQWQTTKLDIGLSYGFLLGKDRYLVGFDYGSVFIYDLKANGEIVWTSAQNGITDPIRLPNKNSFLFNEAKDYHELCIFDAGRLKLIPLNLAKISNLEGIYEYIQGYAVVESSIPVIFVCCKQVYLCYELTADFKAVERLRSTDTSLKKRKPNCRNVNDEGGYEFSEATKLKGKNEIILNSAYKNSLKFGCSRWRISVLTFRYDKNNKIDMTSWCFTELYDFYQDENRNEFTISKFDDKLQEFKFWKNYKDIENSCESEDQRCLSLLRTNR